MAQEALLSPGSELDSLLVAVGVVSGAYGCLLAALRVRIRRRRRPRLRVSPLLPRTLPFLGVALALTPSEAHASSRFLDLPQSRTHRPPWSRAGGSPPPRPLAREGARLPSSHPAIHFGTLTTARGEATSGQSVKSAHRHEHAHDRLFPRAGKSCRTHTVVPGDTLWGIAARALATDDSRRIARYWPKIHRANRAEVPDPNLIRPGQVLRLPDECDA